MQPRQLTAVLKQEAERIGFTLSGCCPAVEPAGLSRFHDWLAAGYAGSMSYLAERREAYEHPAHVLEGVRSLLMLALPYATEPQAEAIPPGAGRISNYAWGDADYHDLIHNKLKRLIGKLHECDPEARARGVVDTAPLLEREFAQLAGLGWIGKNTMLINPGEGSFFFLAAVLTDAVLDYDQPFTADHCGTCRACLDACPTDAFPRGYTLDATRCISYLTIELRDSIPAPLREPTGQWLFGCDVCQQVCPWNRFATPSEEPGFAPSDGTNPVDAAALFSLTDAQFRNRFRRTPLWRSKRRGVLRNAAIVLGNHPGPDTLAALSRGLNDSEWLVRAASAWALGRLKSEAADAELRRRREIETEADVALEIDGALGR